MSAARHFLDCNATAPLRPEARQVMITAMDRLGNPSSVHTEGRTARAIMDKARWQVAEMTSVSPSSVYFTSGATEANNWALAQAEGGVSAYADSHDSVLRDVENQDGAILSVESDGKCDPAVLEYTAAPGLVSVAAVNNETGVIQAVGDLGKVCREKGLLLHVDAVQAPGKLALPDLTNFVNFLTLSAHKIGGPPGVGALIMVDGSDPIPLILGGGQENRRRAGTENLIGIAGFGAAAAAVEAGWTGEAKRMQGLRDKLEAELLRLCPEATIYGAEAARVPNTTCIRMPGVPAETQVMALDLGGVAVSAGSACSSGKVTPSHVLRAMGVLEGEAAEAIRISLGWNSTEADVDACTGAWGQLWQRKRAA